MKGKMRESGFPEAIPLICTSAVWGQGPVFPHPELPRARRGEWLQPDGCQLAGACSLLSSLSGVAAAAGDCHILGLLGWQEMFCFSLLVGREL